MDVVKKAKSICKKMLKPPFVLLESEALLELMPYSFTWFAGGKANIAIREVININHVLEFVSTIKPYGIPFWIEVTSEEDIDLLEGQPRVHPLVVAGSNSRELIDYVQLKNDMKLLLMEQQMVNGSTWEDLILTSINVSNKPYLWPITYDGIIAAKRAMKHEKAMLILHEDVYDLFGERKNTYLGITGKNDTQVDVSLRMRLWLERLKKMFIKKT
ncbi:MAG: hypothetical protein ACTSVF_01350 [Candidatus Asgardarchaeia archaeon]